MIPASIAAAASLPLILQGILQMPSLPVLVMLFVGFSTSLSANQAHLPAHHICSGISASIHLRFDVSIAEMSSLGGYFHYWNDLNGAPE